MDFRKLFAALPPDVQRKARKNYKLWRENPAHPSLDFKKTHTRRPSRRMSGPQERWRNIVRYICRIKNAISK